MPIIMDDVEDTMHALFLCFGSPMCDSSGELMGMLSSNDILQRIIMSKALVPILAECAFNVLKVFKKTDRFIASQAFWYGLSLDKVDNGISPGLEYRAL